VTVAVAIALVAPLRTAFAVPGATQRFTLQLHHALGGKADHLAQECGIGALLQKRTKGDLLIGHRGDPRVRVACPTQPYSGSPRWLLTGPPAPDSWRSLRRAGQRPPTPSPGTRPFTSEITIGFDVQPVCNCGHESPRFVRLALRF